MDDMGDALRDHPRMRGEHIEYRLEGASSQGSSPHARGTLYSPHMAGDVKGIIPACAGNTRYLELTLFENGDHPRMRGEHSDTKADNSSMTGSSPHARGTR